MLNIDEIVTKSFNCGVKAGYDKGVLDLSSKIKIRILNSDLKFELEHIREVAKIINEEVKKLTEGEQVEADTHQMPELPEGDHNQ